MVSVTAFITFFFKVGILQFIELLPSDVDLMKLHEHFIHLFLFYLCQFCKLKLQIKAESENQTKLLCFAKLCSESTKVSKCLDVFG